MSQGEVEEKRGSGTCLRCEKNVQDLSLHLRKEHFVLDGHTSEVIEDLMLRIRHLENQMSQLQK
jgi:hypothetical protein